MRAFWKAVSLEMAGLSSDSREFLGGISSRRENIEQGVVRWFGTAQLPPFSAAPEVNQMAKLKSNLAASQAVGVG